MKKANNSVRQINITNDLSELKEHEMVMKHIGSHLDDENKRLYWDGTLMGEDIPIAGEECLPIKSSINLIPTPGLTKFYSDVSLLQDMGVHLQLSVAADPSASTLGAGKNTTVHIFFIGNSVA